MNIVHTCTGDVQGPNLTILAKLSDWKLFNLRISLI